MPESPRVALFVTCLVDLFRPSVGFAAIKLLEEAGCRVEVPRRRPAAASRRSTPAIVATTEAHGPRPDPAFAGYDYVVAPSGSCAGMLRAHLPELFDDEPEMKERAVELAGRCHELVSFLVDVMGVREVAAAACRRPPPTTTAAPACASCRSSGSRASSWQASTA